MNLIWVSHHEWGVSGADSGGHCHHLGAHHTDGTRVMVRGHFAKTSHWQTTDKSISFSPELFVLGSNCIACSLFFAASGATVAGA